MTDAAKRLDQTFIALLVNALREGEGDADEVMSRAVNASGLRRAAWATFTEERRASILRQALKEHRSGIDALYPTRTD